jgi:hypothetical protein
MWGLSGNPVERLQQRREPTLGKSIKTVGGLTLLDRYGSGGGGGCWLGMWLLYTCKWPSDHCAIKLSAKAKTTYRTGWGSWPIAWRVAERLVVHAVGAAGRLELLLLWRRQLLLGALGRAWGLLVGGGRRVRQCRLLGGVVEGRAVRPRRDHRGGPVAFVSWGRHGRGRHHHRGRSHRLLLLLLLRGSHTPIAKGHLVLQVLLQVVGGSVRPRRLLLAARLPALIILTCEKETGVSIVF